MDIIFVLAQQTESVTEPGSLDYIPLRIAISGGIVLLLIVGAIFPKLKIDAFTLGLIVLAILPWLAPIISHVELPGGTKIDLRLKKLEQETNSLAKRSEQNANKAQNATTQSQVALAAVKAGSSANPEETIDTLKKKYNEIREREASGPQRTADMTDIVGKMIAVVGGLTHPGAAPFFTFHGQ